MQATVCGGALSLISDIKKASKDSIKISCNYHAALMLDCDYLIYIDHLRLNQKHTKYMDIEYISGEGLKTMGFCGTAGISLALQLQADQIYLAGIDLYQTGYYYEPGFRPRKSFDEQIILWKAFKNLIGKDAEKVIPLSGPLVDVWSS